MATFGAVDVTGKVDARRVSDVVQALTMLVSIAESYGHRFTAAQQAMLAQAAAACDRQNLTAE